MASQEGLNQDQQVDPGIDDKLQTHNLGDTLGYLPECSKLHEAVLKADAGYLLGRSGLHTLFAPRNDGLPFLNAEQVESFLTKHLVAGGSELSDLHLCKNVKTESGEVLPVSYKEGVLRIGPAAVVRSDIPCTNGFLHIVDRPLV